MHAIPPLGWVAIAAVLLITLAINAWMISLLRNRQDIHPTHRPESDRQPNFQEVLRDPFGQENRQLGELSKRVRDIRQGQAGEPGQVEKDSPRPS